MVIDLLLTYYNRRKNKQGTLAGMAVAGTKLIATDSTIDQKAEY
jgi:hypothetical protein